MDVKPPHYMAAAVAPTEGLWVFVPISDLLIDGAVDINPVAAMAGKVASDTAEQQVKARRHRFEDEKLKEEYNT